MVIQKFLASFELQKFLGNICSFEKLFTEKCRWVPPIIITGKSTIKLFPILVNKGTSWKLWV